MRLDQVLSRIPPTLLLAGLAAVHIVANIAWLREDLALAWFDESWHFINAQHGRSVLAHLGLPGLFTWFFDRSGEVAPYWPLIGYMPGILLSEAVGSGFLGHRLAGTLMLVLLLLFVFLLGRRLHSPGAGLLAAAITSAQPAVFGPSRHISPDLAGITAVTAVLWLLLRTERFSRMGASMWLGIGLGVGCWFRPHYLGFLVFPVLIYAVRTLVWPDLGGRLRALGAMMSAAGLALIVAAPFWWGNLARFASQVLAHQSGQVVLPFGGGQETSLDFYLRVYPLGASPLLFWSTAAAGLLLLSPRAWRQGSGLHRRGPELLLLGIAAVSGTALFSTIPHHYLRYLGPIYPPLTVVAVTALFVGLPRWPRRILSLPLLGVAACTWYACSFGGGGGADRPWLHCDPCWDELRQGQPETGGPPSYNPQIVQLASIVKTMRSLHGDGEGVLLRLEPPATKNLVTLFQTTPMILDLPAIRLVDPAIPRGWRAERPFAIFDYFSQNTPYLYTLAYSPGGRPEDQTFVPETPGRLVGQWPIVGRDPGANYTLWRHF